MLVAKIESSAIVSIMIAEPTYAQKFAKLEPWHRDIFLTVKKELRDEHLKLDRNFFKRNFTGIELQKIAVDDLLNVYPKLIAEGYEPLGEFIANRWLLRHLEIYNFFEERLKQNYAHFDQLQVLDYDFAKTLLDDATAKFGCIDCHIFSVLNCVAFPEDLMKELQQMARHATDALATT